MSKKPAKSTLRQRIVAGTGANAIGQGVTILIQVLTLPIFLHYWDNATYGKWLLLSAVPAYLAMGDFGILFAAGNKLAMTVGKGNRVASVRIFHTATLFLLLVGGSLLVLTGGVCIYLSYIAGSNASEHRYSSVIFILSCSIILTLLGGLADSLMRATGRYPLATLLSNAVRLGEWAGYVAGLALIGSIEAVALSGLVMRVVGCFFLFRTAASGDHMISLGLRHASIQELRELWRPAVSFMLFPLSFAISFQGVTVLVGYIFGASTVTIFNTYRTLTRLVVQLISILSLALGPEFSRLHGKGAYCDIHYLYAKATRVTLVMTLAVCSVTYLISPYILHVWTNSRVSFDWVLMLPMLLAALFASLGHVPRTLLLSINRHEALAKWSVVASAVLIVLSYALAKVFQLSGIALAQILVEIGLTLLCIHLVRLERRRELI